MDKRYLKEANRWFINNYHVSNEKVRMYRLGFLTISAVCIMLCAIILTIFPLKTYVPLPVIVDSEHKIVKPINPGSDKLPIIEPMVEHDVVSYILSRESYNPFLIEHQITKIVNSSSAEVLQVYEKQLNSDASPIKVFGKDGRVETEINNVVFLDAPNEHKPFEETSSSLAQVDFTKTRHLGGQRESEKYTALVTFDYRGVPDNELDAWHNWNGFIVTSYQLRRRA